MSEVVDPSAPCSTHDMPWCALCTGLATQQRHRPTPRDDGPHVTSRYDGRCACCGDEYEAGERIVHSSTYGGWVLTEHTTRDDRPPESPEIDWSDIL